MDKIFLRFFIIFQIFSFCLNEDTNVSLQISRANSNDKTDPLTPLVVSLIGEDTNRKKIKDVDLICVVDVSGSMYGNKISLVKETLLHLVKQMTENDKLAIIPFNSGIPSNSLLSLTAMTKSGINTANNKINALRASGGTNIYAGLTRGLKEIQNNYSSGERIVSMILLSDGWDSSNAYSNFKQLINREGKQNYVFTLHTLGYGESHGVELMHQLSLIRDGGYFFVRSLSTIEAAILEIYGSLSTVYQVNVGITISSQFKIKRIYGMDDMYQYSLINNPLPSIFTTRLIHFVSGKRYTFVALVDIPKDTPSKTPVLKAEISPFGNSAEYLWDNSFDPFAYEDLIKKISADFFQQAYNNGESKGITIMNSALIWISSNYDGNRDWKSEYNGIINDLKNFRTFGKANILSKLRELKTDKLGMHYNDENSYQRQLIDDSYNINTDGWSEQEIKVETPYSFSSSYNYVYFYLKEGSGKINGNIILSGKSSSLIYYYTSSLNIKIKPITSSMKFLYHTEKLNRLQSSIDFSAGGKFFYQKDFPLEFYTQIDGTKDITFNIQFLKLEIKKTEENYEQNFEIKAYIIDSQQIQYLKQNINVQPNNFVSSGYYDIGHRIGKIVLKKENMAKYLSLNYYNYLYIIITKTDSNVEYTNVEGQFSFVPMDYIYSSIPESFYIFSNLSPGQKTPHLYTIQIEQGLGNLTRIEFATSGNELDCKVLKYNNYITGTNEYYEDFKDYEIKRSNSMGKTYIDITQANEETNKFTSVILSIFSKNGEHIAGNELTKLSYEIRYTTQSVYGIYSFNDFNETEGDIEIIPIETENATNITVYFLPLKYKRNEEKYIKEEKTRFYMKLFPIAKKSQKIYETISLFESMTPIKYLEDENYNYKFDFQVDPNNNYFFTTYTVSNVINEILSYKTKKIRRSKFEVKINDDILFGNDYDKEENINLEVEQNITKNYLQIKITDFKDGDYVTLNVKVDNYEYKSIEPTNNIMVIPSSICAGKKLNITTKLKESKVMEYYLEVKLVNQIELKTGENFFFEMLEDFNNTMEITINNDDQAENKINVFIRSNTGDFQVNGLSSTFHNSDIFGSKSINVIQNSGYIEIKAKTGEHIYLYTHIIDDTNKRVISNYQLSLFGYLQEKDCIYFNDEISKIQKYQVRILSDKSISIKYNSSTSFEFTETNVLYIKEFSNKLNKICLKQKNDLESIFFDMQIIDISKEANSKVILQPAILGNIYNDKLSKDEIRYYRQGLFDPNPSDELIYHYSIRQIEGEIEVYIAQCDNFPYCQYSKTDLEKNENVTKLYNLDEVFIYSKKSKDLIKYDPQKIEVYLILCKTDSCQFSFIINKSNSIINLSKLEKFSSKIYKNNIDKFSIKKNKESTEILSISLYTHSGEVVLSSNNKCEDIKHIIFGNLDKLEIPKSCGIDHEIEIYIQANMDSVYSIEFEEIVDLKYSKIKSNIVHMESILNKEKVIEFTPVKNSYFVKFIPINCEIEIKYGENKLLNSYQNIYYYDSFNETDKNYLFNISTKENDCMIYTYLEELTEEFYSILSDQVPYYLTLHENNLNYKLIYPIPNKDYSPSFKINFYEETPINITQSIENEKEEAIEALFSKDIKTNSKILNKCDEDNICYLMIDIQYEKKLNNPIILEIIPKSENIIPGVLIDNQLKQDFVGTNKEQKYMTKISKNEEGEIYFNYKYFSGELIGKLINIDKTSWKDRYDLPKQNEYLAYDNLRQKISFTKKETEKCDNGCYLFVEVHPLEKYSSEKMNMDFSLFLKKSDNIVKLRLNEVIMGTLSKTISDNYIEYYSIEIPYSTKKIFIDYSSENTNVVINSNNTKPTKDQKELSFESTGKDQIYIIEDNSKELKGKKYIIGIYTNKLNNGVSQYSFRIRAEQALFQNYIYSDISTENICNAKEKNDKCYFIIPIVSIQNNTSLFLYGISTSNSDDLIISYKKIKMNENIIKNGKYIDDDKYTKTSKDGFIKNMLYISNSELDLKEDENLLIRIESPEPGTITLLHTFKFDLIESLLNPKNKEVFYLNPNSEIYINIPQGVKSLVHINIITGKGKLGYENDENSMQEISGKYSSMYLQGKENNENRIKIIVDKDSNFIFYAYMKIGSIKRNINELGLGSALLRTGEGFPIEFYSKVSENEDYVINFNLNNFNFQNYKEGNDDMNIFNIKAYIVNEEIIEKLKLDDTYVYDNKNPVKGKYEIGFSMGKIALNKDYINKYYSKGNKNYIYLIIEDSYSNPTILNNILGEVTILQNNNIDYVAPNNIYINGNLEKDSTNKYKFIKKNSDDKTMRIEFSPSSENVKYKMYYYTNTKLMQDSNIDFTEKENLGKKIIDINLENKPDTIIFEVYKENQENDINKLSYSLRYRTDKEKNKFKNYLIEDEIKIKEEKKGDDTIDISLSIPTIKDNQTLNVILADYYIKIYKYSENDLLINKTISIIDNLDPYKIIEFATNSTSYTHKIQIPNDKNKYYLLVNAITSDRELLSYNSLMINEESSGGLKWYWILLIILGVLLLIVAIILIVRCLKKKKKNEVEETMIPMSMENKILA